MKTQKSFGYISSIILDNEKNKLLDTDQVYDLFKKDYKRKNVRKALKMLNLSASFNSIKNISIDKNQLQTEEIAKKSTNVLTNYRPPINKNSTIIKIKDKNIDKRKKQNSSEIVENKKKISPERTDEIKLRNSASASKYSKTDDCINTIALFESYLGIESHESDPKNILTKHISKNVENSNLFIKEKHIGIESIMNLKKKFFGKEKMTRGEIVEMYYGIEIPKINFKNSVRINEKYSEDFQQKVNEIMENQPKIILTLIEKGEISDKEVIDYFNIGSLKLTWTPKLEKIYRSIVYNQISTKSNMLRTTYFLIHIGFHHVMKGKFEERHIITLDNFKEIEIQDTSIIYDKIKKYPINVIREACHKIENLFQAKDKIVNQLINKARNNYYSKRVNEFKEREKVKKKMEAQVNKMEISEKIKLKSYVFNIRQSFKNLEMKVKKDSSHDKTINHSRNTSITKPIRLYNLNYDKCDKLNIINKEKIKNSKHYIKVLINFYRKEIFANFKYRFIRQIIPIKSFDWKVFYQKNSDTKKIVNYYATKIQASIKSYMIKSYLKKMIAKTIILQRSLLKYCYIKRSTLNLFSTEKLIPIGNPKNTIPKQELNRLKIMIGCFVRNYKNRGIYLFQSNKDKIKQFCKVLLKINDFKVPDIVKLHKILLFLENSINKITHML